MRRFFIVILLLLAIFLCACTADLQTVSQDTLKEKEGSAIAKFSQDDLVFMIGDKQYPLNSDVSLLLEAFGEDYSLSTAPGCVYEGEDKVFNYSFASIFTYPNDEKDMIDEIFIFEGEYQTSKGIKIGSTLQDIKSHYGNGGFEIDSSYVYVMSGDINDLKSPKLYFDLVDEKVTGISYYAASNIIQ